MNAQSHSQLQRVLEAVPPGYLVTASWLTDQGVSYSSFRDYVKRGWLQRVTRGVFRRPGAAVRRTDVVDWQTCVLSLQHVMRGEFHVGGATALHLEGLGHHLPLGGMPHIWLYGDGVPRWLKRVPLNAELVTRSLSLFEGPAPGVGSRENDDLAVLAADAPPRWTLIRSTPERAILELIDEVPDHESLEAVDKTFEVLTSLRPRMLGELLTRCKRVKTKRLFFVFADRHDHGWRKYVQPEDYDLGRGDRALIPGGSIHPRYRIVLPREFFSSGEGG